MQQKYNSNRAPGLKVAIGVKSGKSLLGIVPQVKSLKKSGGPSGPTKPKGKIEDKNTVEVDEKDNEFSQQ